MDKRKNKLTPKEIAELIAKIEESEKCPAPDKQDKRS